MSYLVIQSDIKIPKKYNHPVIMKVNSSMRNECKITISYWTADFSESEILLSHFIAYRLVVYYLRLIIFLAIILNIL